MLQYVLIIADKLFHHEQSQVGQISFLSEGNVIMRPIPNASPGGTVRRFIFSDVSEEEEAYYKRKIEELGGIVESTAKIIFDPCCTHVIAKNFVLTEKVLSALARGERVHYHKSIYVVIVYCFHSLNNIRTTRYFSVYCTVSDSYLWTKVEL